MDFSTIAINYTSFFILVQNPKRYGYVGSVEQISWEDDDGSHEVVFDGIYSPYIHY